MGGKYWGHTCCSCVWLIWPMVWHQLPKCDCSSVWLFHQSESFLEIHKLWNAKFLLSCLQQPWCKQITSILCPLMTVSWQCTIPLATISWFPYPSQNDLHQIGLISGHSEAWLSTADHNSSTYWIHPVIGVETRLRNITDSDISLANKFSIRYKIHRLKWKRSGGVSVIIEVMKDIIITPQSDVKLQGERLM